VALRREPRSARSPEFSLASRFGLSYREVIADFQQERFDRMKVLILGVNGFIGSHLVHRVLGETDWEVFGMDLSSDRLGTCLDSKRFRFLEGDIGISREWIEYHIKKCDVCLPLVAIATPGTYVKDPLGVFALDFEENLRIIRQCARFETRVIFPSTSEVYGMCPDETFSEETSVLVYGPISKQRWIYACAKQLLDRVIWAMGKHEGLKFTLVRPFNWIGPSLDDIQAAKEGSSRVVTQFLGHILRGESISLVDGGKQKRAFTFIDDGIDALMRILENRNGACDGRIFNIGNPANDCSIRELAQMMLEIYAEVSGREPAKVSLEDVPHETYYGDGYEDMPHRDPDITLAREVLGWEPRFSMREALRRTISHYVARPDESSRL
jgi:nucleoside-diphosphate-sugar epimerase